MSESKDTKGFNWGLILYPGFQALDAFGPIDCLNVLANDTRSNLSIIAETLDPVTTETAPFRAAANEPNAHTGSLFAQSIVPTHTFATAPPDLDVLIVPGGWGRRATDEQLGGLLPFLAERCKPPPAPLSSSSSSAPRRIKYLFTVCTGSALAARAGVLDGRRATTNKRAFTEVSTAHPHTEWVARARWVEDDGGSSISGNISTSNPNSKGVKIWTTSGVTAGIDGMLALIVRLHGAKEAKRIADMLEYVPHEDSRDDPFAALYDLA